MLIDLGLIHVCEGSFCVGPTFLANRIRSLLFLFPFVVPFPFGWTFEGGAYGFFLVLVLL
jgi:hypothetical protein